MIALLAATVATQAITVELVPYVLPFSVSRNGRFMVGSYDQEGFIWSAQSGSSAWESRPALRASGMGPMFRMTAVWWSEMAKWVLSFIQSSGSAERALAYCQ